jgi:hypothetical protein
MRLATILIACCLAFGACATDETEPGTDSATPTDAIAESAECCTGPDCCAGNTTCCEADSAPDSAPDSADDN